MEEIVDIAVSDAIGDVVEEVEEGIVGEIGSPGTDEVGVVEIPVVEVSVLADGGLSSEDCERDADVSVLVETVVQETRLVEFWMK